MDSRYVSLLDRARQAVEREGIFHRLAEWNKGSASAASDVPWLRPARAPSNNWLRTVLAAAWRQYLNRLQTNPMVTKAITAAIISALSDVGASQVSGGGGVTARSVMHQFGIGLVIRGPLVHYFHTFLDRVVFARVMDQSRAPVVIGKVLIDQFLFAPPFTALYFYVIGLLEDKSLRDVTRKVRRELLDVMKSNWLIWIPANLIGYYAIPLELRVLWGNVVGILWTAILIAKVRRTGSTPAVTDTAGRETPEERKRGRPAAANSAANGGREQNEM